MDEGLTDAPGARRPRTVAGPSAIQRPHAGGRDSRRCCRSAPTGVRGIAVSGVAGHTGPRSARNHHNTRHDTHRAALHRRGRPRTPLRPRGRGVLRVAAHAVGGHQEARGGARRQDLRARQQRGEPDGAGHRHRAPGAERHRAGRGDQGDRQARPGSAVRRAEAGHHLHDRPLPAAAAGAPRHRADAADAADAAGELHRQAAGHAAHRRARLRHHGRALSRQRPGHRAAVRRALRRRRAALAPAGQARRRSRPSA